MSNDWDAGQAPQQQQQQPAPGWAYAPQQQQQPGQPFQAPLPAYQQATQTPGGRVNVLGILSLAVLLLDALLNGLTPLTFQWVAYTDGNFSLFSLVHGAISAVFILAAIGLGIGGVLQKGAPRFRWAAIGGLVAGCLSAFGYVMSLLSSAMLPLLGY